MNVKLVSLTQPTVEGVKTAEDLIVYAARVSNPSNQLNLETADRLIAFLIRKKHWSPFEQADMGVEVVTSRAIAAQILRHWSLSVQEFSQRYTAASEYEPIQLRQKADKDRQSSTVELPDRYKRYYDMRCATLINEQFALYNEMISEDQGHPPIATECARMILPLTTQTTMYLKGNIRDWIHYLSQRTDPHAQLEHRQIAFEIERIFKENFPNIFKAILATKYEPDLLEEFYEFLENNNALVEKFPIPAKTAVKLFIAHKSTKDAESRKQ